MIKPNMEIAILNDLKNDETIDHPNNHNVMEYIENNILLFELYCKDPIVKNCVDYAVINNYTIDNMLTLIVLSVCDVKNRLFGILVKAVQNGKLDINTIDKCYD